MGGVTGSTWKGRNVLKQKVPANNTSNTASQSTQRSKFGVLAVLSGLFGPAIRIGFNTAAATITQQNVFQSVNAEAVSYVGGVATVDYALLKVSSGVVAGAIPTGAIWNASTGTMLVQWGDNSNGSDALPTDVAHTIAVNIVTGATFIPNKGETRDNTEESTIWASQIGTAAANIRVYLFFKRATSTATSPSNTVIAHA